MLTTGLEATLYPTEPLARSNVFTLFKCYKRLAITLHTMFFMQKITLDKNTLTRKTKDKEHMLKTKFISNLSITGNQK